MTDTIRDTVQDYQDVADAVRVYLDAARTGVPGALRAFMQDHARVVGMVDGSFTAAEPDAFVEWVAKSGPSQAIEACISSIDLSGHVARVRIDVANWLGFRFTDFLLLNKPDGAWLLSSKVFDAHDRNLAEGAEAAEESALAEAEAIEAVARTYIEAARAGDAVRLRGIWLDHARIVGTLDGAPANRTPDAFADRVARSNGAPNVRGRLVSIDRSGPAASARIELEDWNGIQFTDLFTIFKTDGAWRVAGKVFDAHGRR